MLQAFTERGRFTELEPIGVIDIGSNSVRLVVYDGAVRAPVPIFNEKVLCGLGRSIASTGKLGEEAVGRALAALARFRVIARILRVKNLRAVATAAVRDASNGPEFIARGERACGTVIEVLSGEKEADLVAQGVLMGFLDPNGFAGDLGGGSLELVDVAGHRRKAGATLPLGGLRLLDATGGKVDKALASIDEELAKVVWLGHGRGRPFYAVGGTWRSLAHIRMEDTDYPLRVTQGYELPAAEAIEFCQSVRKTKKIASLPGIEDVAKARRELLPLGALVLQRLIERIEPEKIVFSVYGIREGLVYSLLPPHERSKDPLICFCEDFARLRSRSLDHARELCTWTDALFAAPGPKETAAERRLRYAACLTSDIGWRAHPDYRGEQSLSTLVNSAMTGIDHPGRIFLALAVYFRHAEGGDHSAETFPARLMAAISPHTLRRARIIGAAVRTAHMLSVGMPGVIDETPIDYQDGRLVLNLPKAYAALNGERLDRRLAVLAKLLRRHPEIRVSG